MHVPVAYGSMLMIAAFLAYAVWRRKVDDVALLTATVTLAILGNAFVCGALSGPHDRYGARMVWIATFAVLIILMRSFGGDSRDREPLRRIVRARPARLPCRPCRRPRACGRGREYRALPSRE